MNKYPRQLSGGMRQRVSLIRTLVHEPSVILMDEPFGALDALTRLQVRTDLESLWLRRRPTVIFITHSVDEAVYLGDRVLVMSPRPGRVVLDVPVRISEQYGRLLGGQELRQKPEFHELRDTIAAAIYADPDARL